MNHYLYRIINRENNKFYIGMHSTKKYYYDTNYYGSGCFSKDAKRNPDKYLRVLITQAESRKELVALEVLFVTQELVDDPMCYNLKVGGIGAGIGNKNCLGKKNNLGKVRTTAWKEKASAAMKGKKNSLGTVRTAAQKANMSAAQKGNTNTKGQVRTAEQNAANSDRMKEYWRLRKIQQQQGEI